jgi:hypothetical protein
MLRVADSPVALRYDPEYNGLAMRGLNIVILRIEVRLCYIDLGRKSVRITGTGSDMRRLGDSSSVLIDTTETTVNKTRTLARKKT